jgi:hypothetical protein
MQLSFEDSFFSEPKMRQLPSSAKGKQAVVLFATTTTHELKATDVYDTVK